MRCNSVRLGIAASACAAGVAQAQSFQVRLDGAAYAEPIIATPGQTVQISVWLTGGQEIPNFMGWAKYGVRLFVEGAADIDGFERATGGISTEDPNETMPIPTATTLSGWRDVPDTWTSGRRPGGGSALDGQLNSLGWRLPLIPNPLNPGPHPASFAASATANGFQILQSPAFGGTPNALTLTGSQGDGNQFPMFTSEHINFENDVEILRFSYTPETIGDHVVRLEAMLAHAFINNNLGIGEDVTSFLHESPTATITLPTPTGTALLTLAALAAARRRR